jgi:hypothetical protein
MYGHRVARRGVEVSVSAEVYSPGGEALGQLVLDEFRYMREDRHRSKMHGRLGWNIREVHDDLEI